MKDLYCKKPCATCIFRKENDAVILHQIAVDISNNNTHTCHNTHGKKRKQCAGHMLVAGNENLFVRCAIAFKDPVQVTGKELVFEDMDEFVNHHKKRT
jgi:hypothetical protein